MQRVICAVFLAFAMVAPAFAQKREQVEIPASAGRNLRGVLFLPDSAGPAPAVIVLHTAYGSVERFDEDYARALAKEGFVALAPNYVHSSFDRRFWAPGITDDTAALVDFLRQRPEAKDMPIGTVGFSLGSRGILLSARRPEVKAVVVYYGSFDVRKEKGVKLPPTVPVPLMVAGQVNAAVLLLHGDADDEVPISSAREMKAALEGAGKKVELVEYKGAYHRFDRGPDDRMRGERTREGYTYRKDEAAAKDAFSRTIAWLKEYLR
jgi:dienelactone hydrolase